MAKYSLDVLTSLFITKNARKTRDNLPDSRVTLAPHADAVSLYHAIKDILEYLNITPGGGTGDGIYGGSGTIAPNTISTLSENSVFTIEFSDTGTPLFISDLDKSVTISSQDASHALYVYPTTAGLEGPSGKLETSALTYTFTDTLAGEGIQYAADYSATWTSRSLVDKAYVDSLAFSSAIPPATGPSAFLYFDGTDWVETFVITNRQLVSATNVVTLPHAPISTLPIEVFVNGVLKWPTSDYTITSNTITFVYTLQDADKVTTKYHI
jgi:hypothetical protein